MSVPRKKKLGAASDLIAHVAAVNDTASIQDVPPPQPGVWRVLKFGGSSVGSPEKLSQVVRRSVAETRRLESSREGPSRLAIVVSASGDTTDWLIDAADFAAAGRLDDAKRMMEDIERLAVTNGLAAHASSATEANLAIGVPPSPSPATAGAAAVAVRWEVAAAAAAAGLNAAEGATADAAAPYGERLKAVVRDMLGPLRQLLLGISLLREKTPQALDTVLSFGERLSAAVLVGLLEEAGVPSVLVDARSWVTTDVGFGHAKVDWPTSRCKLLALRPAWGERAVPVVTGFIGRTPDGRTTTLGRNGSDYTATMLGAALRAESVTINTDSYGVMTADPHIVKNAFPVLQLTYHEALDLAVYGARIFHARTMLPLIESGVPMIIRNTADPDGPCTTICAGHHRHGTGSGPGSNYGTRNGGGGYSSRNGVGGAGPGGCGPRSNSTGMWGGAAVAAAGAAGVVVGMATPTCVTSLERLGMLELRSRKLEDAASLTGRVFKALEQRQITVYAGLQAAHGQSVTVIVPQAQVPSAREALTAEFRLEAADGELDPVTCLEPITMLSLVEEDLRTAPATAARFFGALAACRVNVLATAAGPRSLSVAVAADDTGIAVRAVHDAFNLAHQKVSVLLLADRGNQTEGGGLAAELVRVLQRQRQALLEASRVDLTVVGVVAAAGLGVDTANAVAATTFDADGLPPDAVTSSLAGTAGSACAVLNAESTATVDSVPRELLQELARLAVPVLVDCRSSAGVHPAAAAALYRTALQLGIHVVPSHVKGLLGLLNNGDNYGSEKAATSHDGTETNGMPEYAAAYGTSTDSFTSTVPLPYPFGPSGGGCDVYSSSRIVGGHGASLIFDSAVGGGSLPVLETLRKLVRAGDVVHRIEASLSGALGLVLNRVRGGSNGRGGSSGGGGGGGGAGTGEPLSSAVAAAAAAGLIEGDVWEELAGIHVAERVSVLLHELGWGDLSVRDMDVRPIVDGLGSREDFSATTAAAAAAAPRPEPEPEPEPVAAAAVAAGTAAPGPAATAASTAASAAAAGVEAALRPHDAAFAARVAVAAVRGQRLRHLAVIRFGRRRPSHPPCAASVRVGLAEVGEEHPAFGLRQTQIQLAVHSDRHGGDSGRGGGSGSGSGGGAPLVLQGAGPARQEGAAGLLNDVLALSLALKG